MKTLRLFLILLFTIPISTQQRSLYVDDFYYILGNYNKEQELLYFAKEHNFSSLILYDLDKIYKKRFSITDSTENFVLANFIRKAKTSFKIKKIGASGENGDFFITHIMPYNKSRINPLEKFDIFNLEFEFWKKEAVSYGGYYCNNYLKNNGIPCNRTGGLNYYLETLCIMELLANESEHPIIVEAYVGNFNKNEIKKILRYTDRLLVSSYETNPLSVYINVKKRLKIIEQVQNEMKDNSVISVIFSSEKKYMCGHLQHNSFERTEKEFLNKLKKDSTLPLDFTYYNYTEVKKTHSYFDRTYK